MWYSNRRRCGAWPLFFSPCCRFAPVLGLGLLRRPDGCCRSPARCLAGFSSLGCLLAALLEVYLSIFEQLVSWQGASASTPLFPRGEGSWFLRLAWRYGCRFWRRSLPLPMVFSWRWGHGVRLYLLGWFAILEVLVLKSRVSPFLMVSSLLAWCLEFWAPVQWPPFRGEPSGSSVRSVEFACSTGHLASCVGLFARFRPACGLVFAALG